MSGYRCKSLEGQCILNEYELLSKYASVGGLFLPLHFSTPEKLLPRVDPTPVGSPLVSFQ